MRVPLLLSVVVFLISACGGDPEGTDGGGHDAAVNDAGDDTPCARAADCDDGLYCNGAETCEPGGAMADARGCVAADSPCAAASCEEGTDTCVCTGNPDMDNDGERSYACGGADCDDDDPRRFPANLETCDDVDQDCNAATFAGDADGDLDGDGFINAACCAEGECGTDCDDTDPAIRPGARESCNAIDDNCSGRSDDPSPEDNICPGGVCAAGRCLFTQWDRLVGEETAILSDIAADSAGNAYVAGLFDGPDLGDEVSAYLVSYSAGGALRWRLTSALGAILGERIAVSPSSTTIYLVGRGFPGAEIDGDPTGDFVAAITPDGSVQWVTEIPVAQDVGLAATASGVVVGGQWDEAFDFGDGVRTPEGNDAGFLAGYDAASGDLTSLWTVGATGATVRLGRLASLPDGDLVVAMSLTGTIDLGGESVSSTGSTLVLRMSRDGAVRWLHDIGMSYVAAVEPNTGGVLIAGSLLGSTDLGDGEVVGSNSAGASHPFVLALDREGGFRWKAVATPPPAAAGRGTVYDLAIRTDGTIFAAGGFFGDMNFGGGALRSSAPSDPNVFVAVFSAEGVFQRDRSFGGDGVQEATGIAMGPGGATTLGGTLIGSANFGSGVRTTGNLTGFIARIGD